MNFLGRDQQSCRVATWGFLCWRSGMSLNNKVCLVLDMTKAPLEPFFLHAVSTVNMCSTINTPTPELSVQQSMLRMDKPNFLGKQGVYSSFLSVILLWKLVFQFLTRRGLGVFWIKLLILFFKHESELEWSWTGSRVSRKACKAQQLSLCCSVSVPHAQKLGRAGRDGGKVSLLQPEEQKSFESKGHAAREEPHSSRPATPAQFSLSVPLLLNFYWTLFYADVVVRGIENKRHGWNAGHFT